MINTESLRITIKGFVLAINMHQVLASIWERSQSQKEDHLKHEEGFSINILMKKRGWANKV